MSDQNDNPTGTTDEQKPAGSTDEQTPEGTEGEQSTEGEGTEGEGEGQNGTKLTDPEELAKELTRVRAEAANYRTRLRDTEARLAEAKTPEEFAEAIAEIRAENEQLSRAVLVSEVARAHDLPKELAELLKGSTEQELKAHAKQLQKFVVAQTPGDLSGGLDPLDDDDEPSDPGALAAKYGRGRHKR